MATTLLLLLDGDAQFASPDADVTAGSWTTHTGATTGLFEQINETSADQSDYIKSSELVVGGDTCEVALSDVIDPTSADNHTVSYQFRKQGTGTMDFTVELMEGTSEIANWTHSDVTTDWVLATQTLTTIQANAISDYTDLRLRFTANVVA